MTTLIRIRGWITEARLINPFKSFVNEKDIYSLKLQPETPAIFNQLEEQVTQIRKLSQESFEPRDHLTAETTHPDTLFDGCEICFQTFIKPRLVDRFEAYERDEELLGEFAQAVGHIQVMKDRNVFLSAHIVEPSHPLDGFDPTH